MAKIKHPTLRDIIKDIPDADLASWLESGWLDASPKPRKRSEPKP